MRLGMLQRRVLMPCTMWLLVAWCAEMVAAAPKPKPLPPFDKIAQAIEDHFRKQPDYQPGDLITRDQVEPLFGRLAAMGFAVPDRREILNKLPGSDEPLVVSLRTPAGRRFMHRIGAYAQAYDRLDRLMRLPHGKQTVQDLIQKPGGEELIKYFATTPGGTAMGKQLSNAQGGAGFNEPTGRIYTVKMLVARLQKSYTAAQSTAPGGPT